MSRIEWTELSWNPVVGCSLVSPGCTNCYAMGMAARIEAMDAALPLHRRTVQHYEGLTKRVNGNHVWTGKLSFAEHKLLEPLKRKRPTTYFVNSMGDLFHEDCPDEWIDKVFAVMALCPQHTFQVLTKRAARMRAYFEKPVERAGMIDCSRADRVGDVMLIHHQIDNGFKCVRWPLPNVWLGVSTEDQRRADERLPDLLATPAAVRFISAEPLLGPIDLNRIHEGYETPEGGVVHMWESCLNGRRFDTWAGCDEDPMRPGHPKLDWVIAGGESGPGSRPMHPDWARNLRDQCAAAGVPFFFKQWGSWFPAVDRDREDPDWRRDYSLASRDPEHFRILNLEGGYGFHGERVHLMQRYSKKASGRLLDGVVHDGMPQRQQQGEAA